MIRLYKTVVLLFLISFSLRENLYPQFLDIQFEKFGIEDGLSFGGVKHIIQDNQGFLWMGTNFGLNRYDGYEFKIYLNSPADPNSISDNQISCLYVDRSGILWVGTRTGLNKYDGYLDKFIRFMHDPADSNSLSSNDIWAIYEDRSGAYWIASGENGLTKVNKKFTNYKHFKPIADNPNSLPDGRSGSMGSMYLDSYDKLWIVTHGDEIETLSSFDINNEYFTHYMHDPNDPHSIGKGFIYPIYEDKSGVVWVGAGGLNRFDRKANTFTQFKHDSYDPNSLRNNIFKAICEDSFGRLWISTERGLNKFDPKTNTFNRVFKDELIFSSIYEDRSGVLWFLGHEQVLLKYDRENEKFPPRYSMNQPDRLSKTGRV